MQHPHSPTRPEQASSLPAVDDADASYWQRFVEHSATGFLISVRERIAYLNPAGATLLGEASPATCLGLALSDVVVPGLHGVLRQRLASLAAGREVPPYEYEIAHSDGGTRRVEVRSVASTFQGEPAVQSVLHDVTVRVERQRLQEALEESEERLRLALDAAHIGTWDLDLASGAIQWSERTWWLHGVTPDLVENTLEGVMKLIVPTDREGIGRAFEEALHEGRGFSCEYRVVHPDGTLRWLQGKGRMRYDGEGRPVRFLGIVLDLTERKRAEQALEEAHRKLQEKQAYLVHSEKMASIGQLAAGVAHEINNPIGFIHSNLGVLADYTQTVHTLLDATQDLLSGTADAEARDAALARIRTLFGEEDITFILDDIDLLVAESRDGSRRVKEIVQSLKRFAHNDNVAMKPADLNELLQTTIRVLRHELKHKAEVHEHFQPLPVLYCNPGQLNQVFMNLLVNAIQAIEEQGTITVATEATEAKVIARISDTGQGIPPDQLGELYNPFYTTKPVGEGSGLGLSIAYGIVKRHGGQIEVESRVGHGTTFEIHLPLRLPSTDASGSDTLPS